MSDTTTPRSNLDTTIEVGKKYSRTNWAVVLSGMLGFVVAIGFIFGLPWKNKNRFHEIDINLRQADNAGREYLKIFLTQHYKDTLAALNKAKGVGGINAKEIERLAKNTDSLAELQRKLYTESYSLDFNNNDTL